MLALSKCDGDKNLGLNRQLLVVILEPLAGHTHGACIRPNHANPNTPAACRRTARKVAVANSHHGTRKRFLSQVILLIFVDVQQSCGTAVAKTNGLMGAGRFPDAFTCLMRCVCMFFFRLKIFCPFQVGGNIIESIKPLGHGACFDALGPFLLICHQRAPQTGGARRWIRPTSI